MVDCTECQDKNWYYGSVHIICKYCNGVGKYFDKISVCLNCNGSGYCERTVRYLCPCTKN